jgi:AcrR family transcriptional regulator
VSDQPARRLGRPPTTVDGRTVPERLVLAAQALFAERGFVGTTVQDVVDRAGVSKGAMYHHFRAKEDLLHEIYGRVLRMQMERLEAVVSGNAPVQHKLWTAAADVVTTTTESLDSSVIFFRSMHLLSDVKRREVRHERRRYHETFRSMIVEGQELGVFRDDVDAELAVDYFFGSLHHLSTWWRPTGRYSGAEVGRAFADLLLAGLVTPGRTPD